MKEQQFEYDIQKRAKAGTAATLRAVISVYIIYLGWTVLKGVRNGSSPGLPANDGDCEEAVEETGENVP